MTLYILIGIEKFYKILLLDEKPEALNAWVELKISCL